MRRPGQNASLASSANGTNGKNHTNGEAEDTEYALKSLINFWAKGDVLVVPGHANPSHLVLTDQRLPVYSLSL